MGGMAADTGAVCQMAKMGLPEGGALTVMATETKSIRLLDQQFRLPGIMGIVAGSTAILQRRMDILALKILPGMACKA